MVIAFRAARIMSCFVAAVTLATCVTAPAVRTSGDISLRILTSGTNFDTDGYTIRIDGVAGPHAAATFGSTVVLPELPPGPHEITLSDLSGNCSVAPTEPHTAVVVAATAVDLTVNVVCTSTDATISIVTTTNASAMSDPDGYVATIGNIGWTYTPNSGTTDFPVNPGMYDVVLSGIEPSCTAVATTQTVTLAALEKRSVSFSVTCGAYATTVAGAAAVDPPNDTLANAIRENVVSYDLLGLATRYSGSFLTVSLKFGRPIGTSQIVGYVDIDLDENATTGVKPRMNSFGGSAPQGAEAEIRFQTGGDPYSYLLSTFAVQNDIRMVVDADSVLFYLPMEKLLDEGDVTLTAIVGTFNRATDFMPNSGVIVSHRPPGVIASPLVRPQRRYRIDTQRASRW